MLFNPINEMRMHDAIREEEQRLARMQRAWRAYAGELKKPLLPKPGEADTNVRLNFGRMIVDKGVAFLFGEAPDIDANNGTTVESAADATTENEVDRDLDAAWAQNLAPILLQNIAINGAVCGTAFVKIQPPPRGKKYPRLVIIDPATIVPFLDPEDFEHVEGYRITWNAMDPSTGQMTEYVQSITENEAGKWEIVEQNRPPTQKAWTTTSSTVWPYDFCPIQACQNRAMPNQFWGQSDLEEDVIEINHSLNFLASNVNKIIAFHAHPKTWGTGFQGVDLRIPVDGLVALPPGATLQNLEMQSDLGSTLAFYEKMKEAIHEISSIPEIATGMVNGLGQLSGVALQVLYQSLVELTKKKRLTYGDLISRLSQCMLEMMGHGSDVEITIHWPDMLPVDDLSTGQTMLIYEQLGVSKSTILARLGFDPEEEESKRNAEDDNAGSALLKAFDGGGKTNTGDSEDDDPENDDGAAAKAGVSNRIGLRTKPRN